MSFDLSDDNDEEVSFNIPCLKPDNITSAKLSYCDIISLTGTCLPYQGLFWKFVWKTNSSLFQRVGKALLDTNMNV